MKLVFVHLLNDRSGSPKVLSNAIKALHRGIVDAQLYIGSAGSGCLDELGLSTTRYWYQRSSVRLFTLFAYVFSQLALFFKLVIAKDRDNRTVIYINTLLPFAAALYGAVTGRRVVYHLHEVSISPAPLRWFLVGVARLAAHRVIYVSHFHRKALPIASVPSTVVYNSLEGKFLTKATANSYCHRRSGVFNILMLASLRHYKGVPELLTLAARLGEREDIRFHLVANDEEDEVLSYFECLHKPSNVTVYPRTGDPGRHYATASLVLNLSRPDLWIETFGLTILEAMAYGVPVIVPPLGGPLELVRDGQEGFLIDCRNGDDLAEKVLMLANNEQLCLRLSDAAKKRALGFSPDAFARALQDVLDFDNAF